MKVTLDYETRSACDLSKCGAAVYAEHESTEIMCCAVKAEKEKPRIWFPSWVWAILETVSEPALSARLDALNPLTDAELFQILEEADELEAHNSFFETCMWLYCASKKYDWPAIQLDKMRCSLAKCSYHALPRSLEQAGEALGLAIKKDMEGSALMKKLCKPRKLTAKQAKELGGAIDPENGMFVPFFPDTEELDWDKARYVWHQEPEQLIRLAEYCCQDTEAEHALSEALADLPPSELQIFQLDQRINLRGIRADIPAAKRFVEEIGILERRLLAETVELTGGAVQSPKQVAAAQRWLAEQGVVLPDLRKNTVAEALKNPDQAPAVRHLLQLRQQLGRSSTAKYKSLLGVANADGRVRGTLLYHGCSTGRWAGAKFQPQNLPRGVIKDVDSCITCFTEHGVGFAEVLWRDPMGAATSCIRGMLIASPGKEFIAADFSSIEARVNAWLASEASMLDDFRNGLDPYKVDASLIFSVKYDEVTKQQRQVGKTSTLSLGYAGGIGAYAKMAANYNVDLETLPAHVLPLANEEILEKAQRNAQNYLKKNPDTMSMQAAIACDIIKQLWRKKRPNIVQSWYSYEEAAVFAVKNRGKAYRTGRVVFKADDQFLRCKLPSGRYLHYYKPHIKEKETPWGQMKPLIHFYGNDSEKKNKFTVQHLWSGLICENIDQAVSRDLMAHGMLNAESRGYEIELTVHDELLSEREIGKGSVSEFEALMSETPDWAAGLPVKAEGWSGPRFKKG